MTLIEDLLDLENPRTIRISPNSQQILYRTELTYGQKKGDHVTSTLWLAETGKPKSSRQLTSGQFNDQAPRWAPDGKSIAFVSDRGKAGESSAIWILPVNAGGEAYALTPAENERGIARFEFSPDGKFIAYCSADEKTEQRKAKDKAKDDAQVWGEDWPFSRLRVVHVATKKISTLVSRDAHVADLAWSDDGTRIAFAEKRTPDIESQFTHGNKISIVEVASKAVTEVCTYPAYMLSLTWAGESLCFVAAIRPVITSSMVVHSIDLSAGTPTYKPCAHGDEDCASALGKAGKDVTVKVIHGMEDQIRMLNGKTLFKRAASIEAWDATFTNDSDEMIVAVAVGDASHPSEVYSTTASGGAMVQLSNHGESLSTHEFGTAKFLSCPSTDGKETIDAVYLTPTSASEPRHPLPTAVLIHGGPYGRSTDAFDALYFMWAPAILAVGYGILLPNYRGGSGHGDRYAGYAGGGCGIYDHADVIALTQHAIDEGLADKERLVVGGWSQGGFLSFLSAVRNGQQGESWRFKGAIPGAGVADAEAMCLTSDIGSVQAQLAGTAPWRAEKSDTEMRTGSALWEVAAAVRKGGVIPPMLILHGEKDQRVPLEQAVGFRRALEEHGLPFEMVVYPREGHIIQERKHLVDMLERVLRFLDVHFQG